MRLLADQDSLLAQDEKWELEAEVADRIAWSWGQMSLVDRFAGGLGRTVQVEVIGAGWLEGLVTSVGADWVELATEQGPTFIRVPAIDSVDGLEGAARDPLNTAAVEKARDWRQLLRQLAQRSATVEVLREDGVGLSGQIVRTGADHIDLVIAGVAGRTQNRSIATARLSLVRVN